MKFKIERKALSIILSLGLILQIAMPAVYAQEPERLKETTGTITAFVELPEEIAKQDLGVGAEESDIILPNTLLVTVERGEVTLRDIELKNIAWQIDEDNSDSYIFDSSQAMSYSYLPVLQDMDYQGNELLLSEDVILPNIYVSIADEPEDDNGDEIDDEDQVFTEKKTIIDFAELSKEIDKQNLMVGAEASDIVLPETLFLTLEREDETLEDIEINHISWEIDGVNSDADVFNSSQAMSYIYLPILPDMDDEGNELVIGEGVALPKIHVLVEKVPMMMFGSGTGAHTYDVSGGNITIEQGTGDTLKVTYDGGTEQDKISKEQSLTLIGETDANHINIIGVTASIIFDNLSIEGPNTVNITGNSIVNLTLVGDNVLNSTKKEVAGLGVSTGNKLTITAESTGNILASASATYADASGIGGGNEEAAGTITINGGTVTATGRLGAGIGGGYRGAGGKITINGGTVIATGDNGAGIGGGQEASGGIININGGTVTATGDYGAGIGGGAYGGPGGIINITGGIISATGGYGAGIGGGGDGRGSGYKSVGAGGTITINGGSVTANGKYGLGIGGGSGYVSVFSSDSIPQGEKGIFTAKGNSFVVASSIQAQEYKTDVDTRGIIFDGIDGMTYGSPIINFDARIPEGKTLKVGNDNNITINTGKTLTNDGSLIINGGTIQGEGALAGDGKFISIADVFIDLSPSFYTGDVIEAEIRIEAPNILGKQFNLGESVSLYPTSFEKKVGECWVSCEASDIKNLGTYRVNGQMTPENIVFSKEFTVKKEDSTLAINDPGEKTYGDGSFQLGFTGTGTTGQITYTSSDHTILSIAGETATIHKSGQVTINATRVEDDKYNEVSAEISLTVKQKELTVKADDKLDVGKGRSMPDFTYTVTGLVYGDTFTTEPILTTTATDTETVGEYPINISGATLNNQSYNISYIDGNLNIITIDVIGITLNKAEFTLMEGAKETLIATFDPTDASNQDVTWSSSDDTVAIVDQTGKITAIDGGTASITVTTEDGNKTATCQVTVDKLNYTYILINDDTEVKITEYTGPGGDIIIPSMIYNKPVTSIGQVVFSNKGLTSVILPENLITIGELAFNNNTLQEVILPESLINIEWSAFSGNQIKKIRIPKNVSSIEGAAFSGNLELVITVDEGNLNYKHCNDGGLYNKDATTIISGTQIVANNLQEGVTCIGNYAFYGMELNNVTLPESLKNIEGAAFLSNLLSNVIIPEGVTDVGYNAFRDNKLTSVILPGSLKKIGYNAFMTNQLTSIIMPESLETIDYDVFLNNAAKGMDFIIYGKSGSKAQSYSSEKHTFKALYAVTFEAGENGSINGETSYEDIIEESEWSTALTVPTPVANTGYKFEGWTPELPTRVTSDSTYTANFIEDYNITITYDAGTGGSVNPENESLAPITGIAEGSTATADEGYIFVNWINLSGTEVSTSAKFVPIKVNGVNEAETYTANFTKDESQWYTVKFEAGANGNLTGTVLFEDILVGTVWSEAITVPETVANAGYKFKEWTPEFSTEITATATYTANFTANTNTKYSVEHYQQNILDDEYTKVDADTENLTGTTGTQTVAGAKDYTGFTAQTITQETISGEENTLVKIYYDREIFTVRFADYDEIKIVEEKVRYGGKATPPANPTREGYTFTEWDVSFDYIVADTIIKAQYTINKYTVKFIDYDEEVLSESEVEHGSSATVPSDPTRIGYTFKEWQGTYTNITEAATVNAIYTANTNTKYTVEHYQQNIVDDEYTKVDTVDMEGTTDEQTEVTARDYTGFTAQAITQETISGEGDTIVRVNYNRNLLTVSFEDHDGTQVGEEVSVRYGGDIIAPDNPTRTGYAFKEWQGTYTNVTEAATVKAIYTANTDTKYTVEHYQQNILDDEYTKVDTVEMQGTTGIQTEAAAKDYIGFIGQAITQMTISGEGNTIVKVYYDREVYNVRFNDYDETIIESKDVRYGGDATAPLVNPTREGFTFLGWDKSLDNILADTTVTAEYGINEYTVTFVDYDGKTLKTEELAEGFSATAPSKPTRAGYTFTGWDKGFNDITANLIVTAQYSKDSSGSTGGGSSSGGSSSGGGGSSPDPEPTDDKKTESKDTITVAPTKEADGPTKAIATVTSTVTKGTANVTLSKVTVADAIKKAEAEAKKNGTEKDGISIEIKVDTKNTKASNLSTNLPKVTLDELVKVGVKEFSINSDIGTINLDFETLKTIQEQVGTDVNVSMIKVDKTTLSQEVKSLVGDRPVFDFTITGSNGKKITEFGKGKITIALPYTLAADEKAENVVVYYIDGNGKIKEMPNSVYNKADGTISFETDHFSKFAIGYKEDKVATSFTDITSHWAKDDIEFVTAKGLFSGTGESKFSPDISMTRGMFVTVLGRLDNVDTSNYKESKFIDVELDDYYMAYVEWASDNGIVSGISQEEFAPDMAISREQMAVILYRYSKFKGYDTTQGGMAISEFKDYESISEYALQGMAWTVNTGLIQGSDNNLNPKQSATRAQVAAILNRFSEKIEE